MDCDLSNTEAPGPEPRNRFKTLLDWLAGASALLYVFSRFVPWAPPDASKYSEIDLSWLQFLHQAFLEHLQCGRDFIFTFGPWGFLYGGYYPLSGYRSDMRLRLFRLEFPTHPMANSDGFRRICGLADILPHSQLLYANRGLEMAFWPETGTVLAVPANSAFQVLPSGRPSRLRLGFGLSPSESANNQTTNEVEFRVSCKEEGNEPVSLWSRRLAPAAQQSDRGAQHAVIDLPDRLASKFLLQILPGSTSQNGTLSCYWSEIQFE